MTTSVKVHVDLGVPVDSPGRVAASVAVASTVSVSEELSVSDQDGNALPVTEVGVRRGGRMHLIEARQGDLRISYDATVLLEAPAEEPVTAEEELLYRRPSRYCPSDRIGGVAAAELGATGSAADLAHAAAQWINQTVSYTAGSTDVEDDALAPLLARQGVCRDFAHLGIALCRSMGVPARYVSVYAPGLDPMDFHAVFEAAVDGRWLVFDPTMLAPRSSLVRIATGRDAADCALLTPLGAAIGAPSTHLTVTADPGLPDDDPQLDVVLA